MSYLKNVKWNNLIEAWANFWLYPGPMNFETDFLVTN